jgi:hypothetical protein
MSMKNYSDTIGNRSRDLSVCSAVPQPLRHREPPHVKAPYRNCIYICLPKRESVGSKHVENTKIKNQNINLEYVRVVGL